MVMLRYYRQPGLSPAATQNVVAQLEAATSGLKICTVQSELSFYIELCEGCEGE